MRRGQHNNQAQGSPKQLKQTILLLVKSLSSLFRDSLTASGRLQNSMHVCTSRYRNLSEHQCLYLTILSKMLRALVRSRLSRLRPIATVGVHAGLESTARISSVAARTLHSSACLSARQRAGNIAGIKGRDDEVASHFQELDETIDDDISASSQPASPASTAVPPTHPPNANDDTAGSVLHDDETSQEEADNLSQEILAVREASLESLDLNAAIDSGYAPLSEGFVWLSFPNLGLTLPLPSRLAGSSAAQPSAAETGPSQTSSTGSTTDAGTPWIWHGWSGTGEFFGMRVESLVFAPLPDHRSIRPDQFAGEQRQGAHRLLPVRITVHQYNGLFQNPLIRALHGSATQLGNLLARFHMMRHMPEGRVAETEATRPPQPIHTWHRPPAEPSDASSLQAGPVDRRDVLGIDYECQFDKGKPAVRHALTYVVDNASDRVYEVCVSAPAMQWDALWSGESESDAADADAASSSSRPRRQPGKPSKTTTTSSRVPPSYSPTALPTPSPSDISVAGAGRGLQLIVDHCTISQDVSPDGSADSS